MICILHLQNFRYYYIRIFFRKNTTCQKIIGGAKPPRAPPHSLRHCLATLKKLLRLYLLPITSSKYGWKTFLPDYANSLTF